MYYLAVQKCTKNIIEHKDIPPTNKLSDFCMDKILTKKEAKMFAQRIKKDKSLWKKKNILMNILGTASYIEGAEGYKHYHTEFLKTNKILNTKYKDLLDIVLKYFKNRSQNSTVKYRFAYPGFHIFDCNKLFSLPVASVHQDLQYKHLKFNKNENIDLDNTLSFTLCLELPPTGGGLFTFEDDKKTKINYKEGYIVCHNGQTTHMIAPSTSVSDSKQYYRITLQGHGIYEKNSNTWYLYW
jgi:hypothetical protein